MKSFFKIVLIASLFVVGLPTIDAQQVLNEGQIEYEITNIDSEDVQAQMMQGSMINIYFNQEKTKMNVQMMGGMVTMDLITELATETSTMLVNMMGRKAMVKQPKEDGDTKEANKPDFDITYDNSETKEILGEKCVKATLVNKETKESIILYVAQGLKAKVEFLEKMFPGLKGLPMEMNAESQGMAITITAQSIEKSVPVSKFEIPEGYEEMTQEEFDKEMGGMGTLGF